MTMCCYSLILFKVVAVNDVQCNREVGKGLQRTKEFYDETMNPNGPVLPGCCSLKGAQEGHCAAECCHLSVGHGLKAPVLQSAGHAQCTSGFFIPALIGCAFENAC